MVNIVTKSEDLWANKEIERWQMNKLGVDPLRHYISEVITTMLDSIPRDIIHYTGVDYNIIEDIITHEPETENEKNVYDLYNEYVEVDKAARILNKMLEEYMMGG